MLRRIDAVRRRARSNTDLRGRRTPASARHCTSPSQHGRLLWIGTNPSASSAFAMSTAIPTMQVSFRCVGRPSYSPYRESGHRFQAALPRSQRSSVRASDPRRGARHPPGASSSVRRRRASSPATSSPSRPPSCAVTRCSSSSSFRADASTSPAPARIRVGAADRRYCRVVVAAR